MNLIKKILIVLLFFVWITSNSIVYWAWETTNPCIIEDIDKNFDVWKALDGCLEWTALVSWKDAWITWNNWIWLKIKAWVDNIGLYLLIFAVWSIVFGALMMTLSTWDDEKIKKAKDIVKWWIIWFIWLISASAIINLVVKIMYSI